MSQEIRRYMDVDHFDPTFGDHMTVRIPHHEGEWVKYTDHAQVVAEFTALTQALSNQLTVITEHRDRLLTRLQEFVG